MLRDVAIRDYTPAVSASKDGPPRPPGGLERSRRAGRNEAHEAGRQRGLRSRALYWILTVFKRKFETLFAFLIFFVFVISLQCLAGAYQADFGGHPDEPAHFVTGLMARDWLAAGMPWPPMAYAENYYLHYPKVALGHWPPGFYGLEGIWYLAAPPSRASAMLLQAALAGLLGLMIFRTTARITGRIAAVFTALVFLSMPVVQKSSQRAMPDIANGVLCFLAALCFARYLEKERARDSILFGLVSSMAVLTHGRAFALGLLPVLCVALTRRFRLLAKLSFWLPLPIVLAASLPWYASLSKVAIRTGNPPAAEVVRVGFSHNPRILVNELGWVFGLLSLLGAIVVWRRITKSEPGNGYWSVAAAIVMASLLFQIAARSAAESRYFVPALAALACFFGACLDWIRQRVMRSGLPLAPALVVVLAPVAAMFLWFTFRIPAASASTYRDVARELLRREELARSVFLISGNASREGAFIAEIAAGERRPGHFVLRASKALASSTWMGGRYQARFPDAVQAGVFLESVPVDVLALAVPAKGPYNQDQAQLLELARQQPDRWEPLDPGVPTDLLLFRRKGPKSQGAPKIEIDMGRKLGKKLRTP